MASCDHAPLSHHHDPFPRATFEFEGPDSYLVAHTFVQVAPIKVAESVQNSSPFFNLLYSHVQEPSGLKMKSGTVLGIAKRPLT